MDHVVQPRKAVALTVAIVVALAFTSGASGAAHGRSGCTAAEECTASARVHHPIYTMCDNASEPDYPFSRVAPRKCFLGLAASYYDVQPVPGHRRPHAIALKHLKWQHWGRSTARAHGTACNVYSMRCDRAKVVVNKPRRILPAGGRVIYQRIRVRHFPPSAHPYTDWYEPGTDY